jgi:hypothetical protein
LHDTKVYVNANGLNKLLSEAITDGDISGYFTPTTTQGDLIIRGETEDERLPIGDAGKILTSNGTTATWEDAPVSLPDQTSQSGKFLTTTVGTPSWSRIEDRLGGIKNNLLENGGFDAFGVAAEYVITTDAIVDLTTSVSRTDEVSANNTRRLQIEASNGDGTPYDIKAVFTKSQDFGGKQMLAFCEVKTLRPDTFFIAGGNGVEQSRREVINDGSWRYYEIPFVGGDTSQFIEINGETTASQEAISVDNCFMGKVSPDYLARISGAQFVGKLTYQNAANCVWVTTSSTIASYAADTDCSSPVLSGEILAPSTKIPAFRIPNARTDGVYSISASGLFYLQSGSGASYVLSSESSLSGYAEAVSTTDTRSASNIYGSFRYSSSGEKLVEIKSKVASGATSIDVGIGNTSRVLEFTVTFIPDSTNTIVTQNTELTAQSANEFVATIDSDGTVSNENFDWIVGNCLTSIGTGIKSCTMADGIDATTLSCSGMSYSQPDADNINITVRKNTSTTTTNLVVATSASARVNAKFNISCTRSTDYRKHATIVGKFENINSSELCQVYAENNDGDTITVGTEDIPFKTIVKDNCNAWSNAGNTGANTNDAFTAPKTARYLVTGVVNHTTVVEKGVSFRVNGTQRQRISSNPSSSVTVFSSMIDLNQGDVLTIISNNNTTLSSGLFNHNIQITELPDTESIIKNLSTQKTKCQTKFLSANVTTDTTLSDLGFNGLLIGKKYRIYYNFKSNRAGGYDNVILNIRHNSSSILQPTHSYDGATSNGHAFSTSGISDIFTAVSSEVDVLSASVAAGTTIEGNGTTLQTWVQLCELPDTYVETTEW